MSWGASSEAARRVLKSAVAPLLRKRGFKGSFPHFTRMRPDHIDLLSFQFSQFGPDLYIEIASCSPDGAKQTDGAIVSPTKLRTYHAGLMRRRIGPQPALAFLGVEESTAANYFVTQVMTAIEREGEPWWSAPKPIVEVHRTPASLS